MANRVNFIYADDEPGLRVTTPFFIRGSLKGYDVNLEVVDDGLALYQKVIELQGNGVSTHGIVTDHNMPRLNGFEALLRLQSEGIKIPALIITGEGYQELLPKMNMLERTALLAKPFSLDEFKGEVYKIWPEYAPSQSQ